MRLIFLLAASLVFMGDTASARTRVIDADTVQVNGVRVRLNGVDAPEIGTQAGQAARRWMVNHLASGGQLDCELNGERSYNRYIGICYLDGKDIGAALIKAGHALDCYRYSRGRYAHLETPAARSRLARAGYCN